MDGDRSSAVALDRREDVVGSLGPREWLWRIVVVVEDDGDGAFQGWDTTVNAELDVPCADSVGRARKSCLDLSLAGAGALFRAG